MCIRDRVVAVAEPAGQDDGLDTLEVGVLVPQVLRAGAGKGGDGVIGVGVAVAPGEHDDAEAHGRGAHPSALAEREGVVLDDRVGEQLAAHVVYLRAGGLGAETGTRDSEVDDCLLYTSPSPRD